MTLAKIAGVLIYSVVFAEFFVRIMDPVPLLPRYVTGAEDGIRRNMANAAYWQTTPEVQVEIRINSQGMRADRDFKLQPDEGVCRIALFGDSFFMGYEVALEDSIAGKLKADLRQRGYRVEVLNFAVSGFGSAENLIALQERALKFRPDAVIFEWHSTDIDDDIRSQLFRLENRELVRHQKIFLPAIETRDFLMQFAAYRWLIGNSHLYGFARESAAKAVKGILVHLASIKQVHAGVPMSGPPGEPSAGNGEPSAGNGEPSAEKGEPSAGNREPSAGEGEPSADKQEPSADEQKPPAEKAPSDNAQLSYAILKRAQATARDAGAVFLLADIPIRHSRTRFEPSTGILPKKVYEEFNVANPIADFNQHAGPDTMLYYEQGHFHLTPLGNQLFVDNILEGLLADENSLRQCRASVMGGPGNHDGGFF